MRSGNNSKINEEQVCIDSLVYFLSIKYPHSKISIKKEDNDPPDFWLTISEEKYAVEVTSIVDDFDYTARCIRLEEYIHEKCKEKKCLNGLYALTIYRKPEIPKYNSKQWVKIVDKAINYIEITKCKNISQDGCIYRDEGGEVFIQKLSKKTNSVALGGPVVAMWEGEAQQKLYSLFSNALEKKQKTFSQKGIIPGDVKIIIAFYDAFGFCAPSEAKSVFKEIESHYWLHSVYWASSFTNRDNILFPDSPGRKGEFIFSKNQDWLL